MDLSYASLISLPEAPPRAKLPKLLEIWARSPPEDERCERCYLDKCPIYAA